LKDNYGRPINYLRVSVTENCNLSCNYCAPKVNGNGTSPLEYEDLERLLLTFITLGIRKLRITGGEPMLRPGILNFISKIRQTPGLRELSLTTNGVLVEDHLQQLKDAGVDGINFSLDSLNRNQYKTITGKDHLVAVTGAIDKATSLGLCVKTNTVVQRHTNLNEITALSVLAKNLPLTVRFIEQMPFGAAIEKNPVSGNEILHILREEFVEMNINPELEGNCEVYTIPGFLGKIGIIRGYSRTFCNSCNKLRLNSEGKLRLCLYHPHEIDLKPVLHNEDLLKKFIINAINNRPENGLAAEQNIQNPSMALIGG